MKKLLLLPLLLAACAPAYSNAPKPQAGEVVVSTRDTSPNPSNLSPEKLAGIQGFASLSALLILQSKYPTGLPAGYSSFTFPEGQKSMNMLNGKDDPLHIIIDWQAKQEGGSNTVNVKWESTPLGGSFLSIKVKASSSDAKVDTRRIEDALLNRFYQFDGIVFVSSAR